MGAERAGLCLSENFYKQKENGIMPVNPEKMGEQIRALRNSKGITQNELGERLNVAFQTVSKWERGASHT